MKIEDLADNERNPREASQERMEMLAKSMIEHGPLDGFIYNKKFKRMAGGHQRKKIIPEGSKIIIEKRYRKPTPQGTTAYGYIEYQGERWNYREVSWSEDKESAAMIAANKNAGKWHYEKLSEIMLELDRMNVDMDFTMFDNKELEKLFTWTKALEVNEATEEEEWVEMPEFEKPDTEFKVILIFKSEQEREKFCEDKQIKVTNVNNGQWTSRLSSTQST